MVAAGEMHSLALKELVAVGVEYTPAIDFAFPKSNLHLAASPNPFNPSTQITFIGQENQRTSITVHDVRGRLVTKLFSSVTDGRELSVHWNAKTAASGIYFVRMSCGKMTVTEKILLVK